MQHEALETQEGGSLQCRPAGGWFEGAALCDALRGFLSRTPKLSQGLSVPQDLASQHLPAGLPCSLFHRPGFSHTTAWGPALAGRAVLVISQLTPGHTQAPLCTPWARLASALGAILRLDDAQE